MPTNTETKTDAQGVEWVSVDYGATWRPFGLTYRNGNDDRVRVVIQDGMGGYRLEVEDKSRAGYFRAETFEEAAEQLENALAFVGVSIQR